MRRVVDRATGQHGTVHWTHAAGWFTPDDGERDELGRVIPTMLDECMDLVDEREPEVCGGTGNHDYQSVAVCDECVTEGPWDAPYVTMGRWSNDA